MDALKPFSTQSGYRVEFFESPSIINRSEFIEYIDPSQMKDPDAERLLSVPFIIRDEDIIGALIFFTSVQAGQFVVPADDFGAEMDAYLRQSGEMRDIINVLRDRFQFAEPKEEKHGTPTTYQINAVLDKISASGMSSLSAAQREILNTAYSTMENNNIPYMENFVPKFTEFSKINEDSMARPDINISASDDLALQFFWDVKKALQIPENDSTFDAEVHDFVQHYVENHWGLSSDERKKKFDDMHRDTIPPNPQYIPRR